MPLYCIKLCIILNFIQTWNKNVSKEVLHSENTCSWAIISTSDIYLNEMNEHLGTGAFSISSTF